MIGEVLGMVVSVILVVVVNVVEVFVVLVVPVMVVVKVAVVIVVLRLTKNTSLWNDSLAYHMTMASGFSGGVNVGGSYWWS